MSFSRYRPVLLTMLLTFIAAIFLSETFMIRRNVLAKKKDWQIAQEGFINPGLNVVPDLIYRRLLTGYRLRSDHLMGVQRIFSRGKISPTKLESWFRLGNDGYVDLIAGSTDSSYIGVRLSTSSVFPSMIYEADHSGRFLKTWPIDLRPEPGIIHATIENDQLTLGKTFLKLPVEVLRKGRSGVQISFKDTELFAFSAVEKNTKQYLHFFPEGNRLFLYAQTFLLLLFMVLASGYFPRAKILRTASFSVGLAVLLLIFHIVYVPRDEQIDSTIGEFRVLDAYWRPSGEKALEEKYLALHQDRYFPGSHFCDQDGCVVLPGGTLPPEKKGKRVLFFGGSQAQPSLVKSLDESLFYRFDRLIRKERPGIEVLNLNSMGLFRERLAKYGDLLPKLQIDEMIIETLSFDGEVEGIIDFIREWSDRGVRVIFLRRAVNPLMLDEETAASVMGEIKKGFASQLGNDGWHVPEVIRIMPKYREAQKQIGFVFLDPNAHLMSEEVLRSGELFWDGFHFTAWGQKLMAEWLAHEYLKIRQSSK